MTVKTPEITALSVPDTLATLDVNPKLALPVCPLMFVGTLSPGAHSNNFTVELLSDGNDCPIRVVQHAHINLKAQ